VIGWILALLFGGTSALPSDGGTTCEDAPASCDGQDPVIEPVIKVKCRGGCDAPIVYD
jgi:hypothetical protein